MNELNEEIKLTLNLMQGDIDDGAHGELQSHLYSLLEMKRNEMQQRLAERSWSEPALGVDKAKPLTLDELMAGGWWCADVSEECRLALVGIGINTAVDSWDDNARARCALKRYYGSYVARSDMAVDSDTIKRIKRIGNDFYWGEK